MRWKTPEEGDTKITRHFAWFTAPLQDGVVWLDFYWTVWSYVATEDWELGTTGACWACDDSGSRSFGTLEEARADVEGWL